MNIYKIKFSARCPVDKAAIEYTLRIESEAKILVEDIRFVVGNVKRGFHEDIADRLIDILGNRQVLTATHQHVRIKTIREYK